MKKLYEKNELVFAIAWIAIVFLSSGVVNVISRCFGNRNIFYALWSVVMVVALSLFVSKNKLSEKYGLCKPESLQKSKLYYIPLILIVIVPLCFGFKLNYTIPETILRIISGMSAGFFEEILFRGFLFKAIIPKSTKLAIAISSGAFGFAHITNMILGGDPIQALLQICYATAVGFMFAILFYKRKSLLPCIVTHCLMNGLSVVTNIEVWVSSLYLRILDAALISVVSVAYGIYILKRS